MKIFIAALVLLSGCGVNQSGMQAIAPKTYGYVFLKGTCPANDAGKACVCEHKHFHQYSVLECRPKFNQ